MDAREPDYSFRTDAYAWFVVGVLCVGSVVSMTERQVINLLVEPIKADLGISDTQVSLLQGFAFAIFYAAMAIPIGRLADSTNRRNVILAGALLFTLATAACGLAGGFAALFVLRMLVGVGEATLTPAGVSILGDYFPRTQLGRAVGLFIGTTYIGSGIALAAIGALLGWLASRPDVVVPGLGAVADWQLAFILAAIPGVGFAMLLLTLREPPRSQTGSAVAQAVPGRDVWRFAQANAGVLLPLFLGLPILAAGQFGLNAWAPTFFIRTYGWTPGEIGPVFGLMVATLSPAGVVAGGWLADRWLAAGRGDANLRVPMLSALAAIPFVATFPLAGDARLSLLLLAPVMFLGAVPFGAGVAAIPALAPNRMRAQLMAVYLLIANLVGGGAGPWMIAAFTDGIIGDAAQIRWSFAVVGTLLLLLGAGLLSWGMRSMRQTRSAAVAA
jgi:MFS family permease